MNSLMLERVEELNRELERREEAFRINAHMCFKSGGEKVGYTLVSEGNNCAPTIYFQTIEDVWESTEGIVDRLVCIFEQNKVEDIDISKMASKEYILSHVLPKLIPGSNKDAVENRGMVYTEFLDLIVLYFVPVEELCDKNGVASYTLQENVLNMAGVTLEEVHEHAIENLEKEVEVKSMSSIIAEMMGFEEELDEMMVPDDVTMWVVSNKSRVNGAAAILSKTVMNELVEKFGDKFAILPSSIHECIAVPAGSRDDFATMIQEVNAEQVEVEEQLADHPYIYSDGELRIY